MVSRDMKTGKKRWEWSSPSMKSVTMLNGGVRFVNVTAATHGDAATAATGAGTAATGAGDGAATAAEDGAATGAGTAARAHEQEQEREQDQFAPLVVWKTSSGNYTLTMIDDATGE
jgi:hypothetical protein